MMKMIKKDKNSHDEVRGTFEAVETAELEGCLNFSLVIGSFPDFKQELQVGNTVRIENRSQCSHYSHSEHTNSRQIRLE